MWRNLVLVVAVWTIFLSAGRQPTDVSGASVSAASLSSVQKTPFTCSRHFFATTAGGLEHVLAEEVRTLPGASDVSIGKGSVSFTGTLKTGFEAILWLRTALKVMERIDYTSGITSRERLYDWVQRCTAWEKMIFPSQTLKCDAILGQELPHDLTHSHFSALTVKNAIVDRFRAAHGERPSVDLENPDLPLLLYLHRGQGTLYRVWSGEKSLHKRGYRQHATIHKAALRETTAAALLLAAGWKPLPQRINHDCKTLCDPMCGSGTFPIEAALILANTAPGLLRYHRLRSYVQQAESVASAYGDDLYLLRSIADHDAVPVPLRWQYGTPQQRANTNTLLHDIWWDSWEEAQAADLRSQLNCEAEAGSSTIIPFSIAANDQHTGAIKLAVQSAGLAGVHRMIKFTAKNAANYHPSSHPELVIVNPPWDLRLQEGAEDSWMELSSFAAALESDRANDKRVPLTSMWVLTGNEQLPRILRRSFVERLPVRGAPVKMQFLKNAL